MEREFERSTFQSQEKELEKVHVPAGRLEAGQNERRGFPGRELKVEKGSISSSVGLGKELETVPSPAAGE